MSSIPAKLIEDTARELMARAAIDIPPDYREGVRLARDREKNRLARFVLPEMLSHWDIDTPRPPPLVRGPGLAPLLRQARQRSGGGRRARGAGAGAQARDRRRHRRHPAAP